MPNKNFRFLTYFKQGYNYVVYPLAMFNFFSILLVTIKVYFNLPLNETLPIIIVVGLIMLGSIVMLGWWDLRHGSFQMDNTLMFMNNPANQFQVRWMLEVSKKLGIDPSDVEKWHNRALDHHAPAITKQNKERQET